MEKILVMRFSAMGDVAMTVPVLSQLLSQYEVELVVLTRPQFKSFFQSLPNTSLQLCEFKNGVPELFNIYQSLRKNYHFTAVADLHNVLRSQVLRTLFSISGNTIKYLQKGRQEKRREVAHGYPPHELMSQFERYANVFRGLGYKLELDYVLQDFLGLEVSKVRGRIGFAPFAKHPTKQLPMQYIEKTLRLLHDRGYEVQLFAGGENNSWIQDNFNKGLLRKDALCAPMQEQLVMMKSCESVISMDSSNMHLASLVGIPAVTVWGGTHANLGFLGYGQSKDWIVQNTLNCRPCSVYGKAECKRKDFACFDASFPKKIIEKIEIISSFD